MEQPFLNIFNQDVTNLLKNIEAIKVPIQSLYDSGKLSSASVELIQKVKKLFESPYLGCLPAEHLSFLLKILMWFYTAEIEPDIKERVQDWSRGQMRALLISSSKVRKENAFLTTTTTQIFFEKVLSALEMSVSRNMLKRIPEDLITVLCNLGQAMIEQPHQSVFIYSLLHILYHIAQDVPSILQNPSVKKFLELLFQKINKSHLVLSPDDYVKFWLLYPDALENAILSMFSSCYQSIQDENICSATVQLCMELSQLPQACCQSSCLFQHTISIMITILIKTEGNTVIADIIAAFVICVEKYCVKNSLVSLFPDNLQPIVVLLHIPVSAMPSSLKTIHIYKFCDSAISSIKKRMCSEEEISILLVLFPLWYQVLLKTGALEERFYLIGQEQEREIRHGTSIH